jgi:DNA-binding Lrp family transcriptional regulator
MNNFNVVKIELVDQKILCELEDNCRQSLKAIAHKLRISPAVVRYRIKQLEHKDIISNYISSLNLGKLGYTTYKIYLKLHYAPEEDFSDYILKNNQVLHVLKLEGNYDYSLAVAVKKIQDLDFFMSTLKTKFKGLINDYFISLVVYTKLFKARKLWLNYSLKPNLPSTKLLKNSLYSGQEQELISIDEKDKSILKELSQNANCSLIDLSRKTNLSLDVVKYRLRRLQKELILSNRAMINYSKLGYYHYVILLKMRQAAPEDESKLVSWCTFNHSVLYCSKRIGPYDFEINLAINSLAELNLLLDELKKEFSEVIDSHDLILNRKLIKLNYVPL